MLHDSLQALDEVLERYSQPAPLKLILLSGFLLILLTFGFAASSLNIAFFTPDSWAYFELARTIFSDEFYVFTTWRSYLSDTQSISFPFAYPVALALLHQVVGETPLAAVWLNVLLVALVWVVGTQQAVRLGVPAFAALVISTGLLLWPAYVTEAFAGRSMPLAILFVLLALAAYQGKRHLLGGVCLGLAALTRFDYLVLVILFVAGVTVLGRCSLRDTARWIAGAVIGAMPWMVYSMLHFGRFWVSDNSWVAMSAVPAFVTDFPAAATPTVFDAPMDWFTRVLGNVPGLFAAIYAALKSFPPLLGLLAVCIIAARHVQWQRLPVCAIALLLTGASLAPYVPTGYFDQRYFSAALLATSFALAFAFSEAARPIMHAVLAFALVWVLSDAGVDLAKSASANAQRIKHGQFDPNARVLQAVYSCHVRHPGSTIIFPGPPTFASRYGAVTGMKSALLPRNFPRMKPEQRQAYLAYMQPFLVLDNTFQARACGPVQQQQQQEKQQPSQ